MSLTGAECDVSSVGFDLTDMEPAWMFLACQQLRDQRPLELVGDAPSRLGGEGRDA